MKDVRRRMRDCVVEVVEWRRRGRKARVMVICGRRLWVIESCHVMPCYEGGWLVDG
jgi:hypothetical protein